MAAIKLGSLFIEIGIRRKGVEEGIRKTKKSVGGLRKTVNRLAGALAIAFSLAAARRVLLMAENAKLLDARIRNVSRSTAEFNRSQAELLKIANRNGVAFNEVVNQFQAMKIAAKELGRSNEEVLTLTNAVNQLGIIGGASADAMKFSMRQFGQAMAGGIVRAEEFNSIVENTPLLALGIAEGLEVSVGRLRQMVINGEVLSEDVFEAILGQTDKIAKRFEKMPVTTTRAMSAFTNNMQQAFKNLDAEIEASTALADMITDASEEVIPFTNNVIRGATMLSGVWGIFFAGVEAGWRALSLIVGQFIAKTAVGFRSLGPLFRLGMERAVIAVQGSMNDLIKVFNKLPGVDVPLFDVEKNKAAIRDIGQEIQTIMKEEGVLSQEQKMARIKAIDEERKAKIVSLAKETASELKDFEDRLKKKKDAALKIEKITQEEIEAVRKGSATAGFLQGPVSEADKIKAEMGNETQVIINALRERNQAILDATKEGEDQRLQLLEASNARALEEMGVHAVDRIAQIEESEKLRRDFILSQTKLTGEARAQLEQDLIAESADQVLAAQATMYGQMAIGMAQALGDLQDALSQAGVKSKALMASLFLAQKAVQVAMIIANTLTASTGMMAAVPGPAGIALAKVVTGIGFAAAGIVAGLGVGQAVTGGGRRAGGGVGQGMAHQINEGGAPEVLEQGGRRFLLSAKSGGRIIGGGDLARGATRMVSAGMAPTAGDIHNNLKVNVINNGEPMEARVNMVSRDELNIILDKRQEDTINAIDTSLATAQGSTFDALNRSTSPNRRLR